VIFTKKERNVILFVVLALFAGGIWFVVKKYVLGYEPMTFEKKSENDPEYAQYSPETEGKKKPGMNNSQASHIPTKPAAPAPEKNGTEKEKAITKTAAKTIPDTKEPASLAETPQKKININKANVEELVTLPYIGESKAREIVKYREENGLFKKKKDLVAVSGIGEATLKKLEKYIEL